jgi:hypothetical protein
MHEAAIALIAARANAQEAIAEALTGPRSDGHRGEQGPLAAVRSWLAQASAEIDALAAVIAPRCIGASTVERAQAPADASGPGLSFEQEMRIAAGLQDLSAALTICAQRVDQAARVLEVCDRRGGEPGDR